MLAPRRHPTLAHLEPTLPPPPNLPSCPRDRVVRVLLVEDHPAVRVGLRMVLEQLGLQVCGEAEDVRGALEALRASPADLVIVDLSLGGEDGLDLLQQCSDTPLLVYSMFEDAAHVTQALRAGARGYVTKRDATEVLGEAVRRLLAGERYVSPRAEMRLAEAPECLQALEKLSLQEQRVLEMLGQGFTPQLIAAQLAVSPRTVETYCGRLQIKLGVSGMKELRIYAATRRA